MTRILLVDDNQDILAALEMLLELHDYHVITASNAQQAMAAVLHQNIDAVIQDMNFSQGATQGDEGKSLFYQIKDAVPEMPVIIITAWTQLEMAVELVKQGAADYLPKPWDDEKLLATLAKYRKVDSSSTKQLASDYIVHSSEMRALSRQAEKVAQSDINVLITGPNGVGKEKLADFIHQQSHRIHKPFIKVNMGAIPAELMEAELFGAEKGAFTGANQQRVGRFEAADGGTLMLDEIGNLSLQGQMKLLRVLQTGEFERLGSNETIKVDVRVISATNEPLAQNVQQGSFREDLYYRLNVVQLDIPPLADRKDDIIPLAQQFLGTSIKLDQTAIAALLKHSWPGNVRELENCCRRAVVFAENSLLTAADLSLTAVDIVKDEKSDIQAALQKHKGVIKHAAQELGLSRQALYRRIEKYKLAE